MSDQLQVTSEATRYYYSVDLGRAQDHSAVALLEQRAGFSKALRRVVDVYYATYIKRYDLGTPYTTVVRQVANQWQDPRLIKAGTLLVDMGHAGMAVIENMIDEGLDPIGIQITGGYTINQNEDGNYTVPKRELVAAGTILLESNRLYILPELEHSDLLVKEMEAFKMKMNKRGHEQYEGEGEHDDMVMAVLMAAWFACFEEGFYRDVQAMADSDKGAGDYNELYYGLQGDGNDGQ